MTDRELALKAIEVRKNAYAPYSHFTVGAALLAADGRVFAGSNMENAAYSPSLCAERAAFGAALSQGAREFIGIAITGGPEQEPPKEYLPPCGVCRQVMAEFCLPDFKVLLVKSVEDIKTLTLKDLFPYSFNKLNL